MRVICSNHYGLTGTKRSKTDMCKEIGAKLLIDDSLKYARGCAHDGIKVLLFDHKGDYSWNKPSNYERAQQMLKMNNVTDIQTSPEHDDSGIQRVTSWKDIEDLLMPLIDR